VTADGIVIGHPDWWGMIPAVLKGWVDRILRPGIAYWFAETDSGEGNPEELIIAGAVLVFNTSNIPVEREQKVFGDPPDRIWKDCIVSFCRVQTFRRRMFGLVVTSTEKQRKEWLAEVRELKREKFPPVSSKI